MASCLSNASCTNLNPFQTKKKSFKWGFFFLWSSTEHRYVLYCFSFYFPDLSSTDMIFLQSLCCLSLSAACCYRLITNPFKIHCPHQQTCHLTFLPLSYRKPLPLTFGNNTGSNQSPTSGAITPYWLWSGLQIAARKCGQRFILPLHACFYSKQQDGHKLISERQQQLKQAETQSITWPQYRGEIKRSSIHVH